MCVLKARPSCRSRKQMTMVCSFETITHTFFTRHPCIRIVLVPCIYQMDWNSLLSFCSFATSRVLISESSSFFLSPECNRNMRKLLIFYLFFAVSVNTWVINISPSNLTLMSLMWGRSGTGPGSLKSQTTI